ncbi:GNAT family N-acetyltransferase [Varunaivibrio sulfuroxidans]
MADYPTLLRSPVAYPIDDMPTWVISCLFIKAPYRRQGKMSQLIQGASEYAFAQGAAAVDGFPQTSDAEGKHVDRFVGVEGSFIRAGFRRIEVRGPHRVAVRKERA